MAGEAAHLEGRVHQEGIADCGLWIADSKGGRPFRNPKSAIRNLWRDRSCNSISCSSVSTPRSRARPSKARRMYAVASASPKARWRAGFSTPKNAATWSSRRWRSSGTRRRVRRMVQSGAPWGARTPAAAHSPASQRQSKRALWATKMPSSSTRPRRGATSAKRGQPATIWSVIPVSRATAAGTGMPGSSRASYARWTVPPSSIATATSSSRPAGGALPVASTSTTAKRQSAIGRGGGTALEVIPAQRQRHAARTGATADQLAPLDGDHGPLPVPQGLRPVEQVRGRDWLAPRVLELAQGGLVPGVGDHHARPHGDEVAGRRPLLPLLEGAIGPAAEHRLERLIHRL